MTYFHACLVLRLPDVCRNDRKPVSYETAEANQRAVYIAVLKHINLNFRSLITFRGLLSGVFTQTSCTIPCLRNNILQEACYLVMRSITR